MKLLARCQLGIAESGEPPSSFCHGGRVRERVLPDDDRGGGHEPAAPVASSHGYGLE